MTKWQIKFAADFWTDKLSQNAEITQDQLTRFHAELTGILRKREPTAVCMVNDPQIHLALALRSAEIPESAMPLMQVDMVFISDGSIQLRDGDGAAWVEKRAA